ncbi:hypothetical protein JEQ12_015066 [Ovis aries]|uniref:Uncharacterized protein n=1 Tax=Ovis aries TaxID=9940 RepID=A0A836AKE7_SHEEP|nr:hypothetical protein JEQ12_015066 [Ovis aries]
MPDVDWGRYKHLIPDLEEVLILGRNRGPYLKSGQFPCGRCRSTAAASAAASVVWNSNPCWSFSVPAAPIVVRKTELVQQPFRKAAERESGERTRGWENRDPRQRTLIGLELVIQGRTLIRCQATPASLSIQAMHQKPVAAPCPGSSGLS